MGTRRQFSRATTFALAEHVGNHTAHTEMLRPIYAVHKHDCSLLEAANESEELGTLLAERPELLDTVRTSGVCRKSRTQLYGSLQIEPRYRRQQSALGIWACAPVRAAHRRVEVRRCAAAS